MWLGQTLDHLAICDSILPTHQVFPRIDNGPQLPCTIRRCPLFPFRSSGSIHLDGDKHNDDDVDSWEKPVIAITGHTSPT